MNQPFDAWKKELEASLEPAMKEFVSPKHYSELRPEPIEVIENWGLPFHEAQVLKYVARAGRKGGPEKRLEDLKKAAFYLHRRILLLQEGK
jgi:hypothetical protein